MVFSCAKLSAAKVLFSPVRSVSWVRRRFAGTIFYSGPQDGEVEILSRDWTDKVSDRSGFYFRTCGIVVRHVNSHGKSAAPDFAAVESGSQDAPMENNLPPCNEPSA